MTIRWPWSVLPPRNLSVDIAPRSLAGPTSVSGKTQVVSSDAGLWTLALEQVPVVSDDAIKTFRAIATLLEGRLNLIVVPISRFYQPVYPNADALGLYDAVPHSDGTTFSDGTGYVGGSIKVTAAHDAAIRATSLGVLVAYGGDIQPGQHFSIDERLYRIRTFDPVSGAMTFRPPLREAVTTGTELNFDDPVVRCRLASDAEMNLPLDLGRWSFPDVKFIEDV